MSVKSYKNFMKTDKEIMDEVMNETYEEIMKNISDEVDTNQIEATEKELEKVKANIDLKKVELEKQLENLENLEVETFTDENQDLVADKKKQIGEIIEKLKGDIEAYQNDVDNIREKLLKIKDQGKQTNEAKYTVTDDEYDKLDYLDSAHLRRTIEIANKEPQVGWWVNLSREFGDVWHKITRASINEENLKWSYISYWEHRRLNGHDEKTTHESDTTYFHNIRDVQPTLPDEAHIIFDENGQTRR